MGDDENETRIEPDPEAPPDEENPEDVEWVGPLHNRLNVKSGSHVVTPLTDDNIKSLRVTRRSDKRINETAGAGALNIHLKDDGSLYARSEPRARGAEQANVSEGEFEQLAQEEGDVLRPSERKIEAADGKYPEELEWVSVPHNNWNVPTDTHTVTPLTDDAVKSLEVTKWADEPINRTVGAGTLNIQTKDGVVLAKSKSRNRKPDLTDTEVSDIIESNRRYTRGKRRKAEEEDKSGNRKKINVSFE